MSEAAMSDEIEKCELAWQCQISFGGHRYGKLDWSDDHLQEIIGELDSDSRDEEGAEEESEEEEESEAESDQQEEAEVDSGSGGGSEEGVVSDDSDWDDGDEEVAFCAAEAESDDEGVSDNGGRAWRRRLLLKVLSWQSGVDSLHAEDDGPEVCVKDFCANSCCRNPACPFEHVEEFEGVLANEVVVRRFNHPEYAYVFGWPR